MRVAIVIERFEPGAGGVEQAAFQAASGLAGRGLEIDVLCRRSGVPAPPGVKVRRLLVPSLWQPLRVLAFSARAARHAPSYDVVHSFSRTRVQHVYRAGGGSHAIYMERMYARPEWRARLSPRHRTILAIEASVFADPRQIIQCNARMNAREIATRHGVAAERLVTIYNGVDVERFTPSGRGSRGAALRERLGLTGAVALFAGSGFERKGLDVAIRGLADSQVDATLLVAGAGDTAPYLELARRCGVSGRVRFLGRSSAMPDLYAASDLFVLPTRYDPFANVCLEAMSSGVAVATTPTNGASELIEPGVSGWIGTDDFSAAFALLKDVESLRGMGRAARQIAEQLTWSRHVEQVMALYRKVAR